MNRRKFFRTLTGFGIASFLTGLYAWQIEPFWLEFVERRMKLRNLPETLKGKTLMQISDMHIGNRFSRQYLIDSLREAQSYNPDFVVFTGDFVSYETKEQFMQLDEVIRYAPAGKIATIGILGNHDYGKGWKEDDVADKITKILRDHAVVMLRNEKFAAEGLVFTGLDDYWGTNYDPGEILGAIDHDAANIVLCHNPDVCDEPVWHGYNSWILSGHTHGGQVKPPFLPAPLLPVKNRSYDAGEIKLSGGRTLYINRALGHLHQIRFNVRPEITVFTLEQA